MWNETVNEAEIEREFREEYEEARSEDVALMKRALLNERAAPVLLEYQLELVHKLKNAVDAQEVMLEDANKTIGKVMKLNIVQMELDRVKFLLAEYLRTRLRKIQRYTLHILANPELRDRLSEEERAYAMAYIDLDADHFQSLLLTKLPRVYGGLTGEEDGVDMIPTPDKYSFVFCRVERDIGNLQIQDEAGTSSASLSKDDLVAIRYSAVESLLEAGDVSLL